MKNFKYTTGLILLLFLMACTNGKGELVTKNFDLSNFDKVELHTKGELFIIVDQNQYLEVEAQQNIIDILKIDVKDGRLIIKEKPGKNIGKYDELNYYVHAPSIREVKTSASGNITAENGVSASEFSAKTSASGNIHIVGLNCQQVNASCSASGNITLNGTTNSADLSLSASGNIRAFGLTSGTTKAKTSASGNIETTTTNQLEAHISASGDVLYKGQPSLDIDDNGSGSIVNAN